MEVEPIFLLSSADAAESTSIWKTFINDYEQKKMGVGSFDLPLFIRWYLKEPKVSFLTNLSASLDYWKIILCGRCIGFLSPWG